MNTSTMFAVRSSRVLVTVVALTAALLVPAGMASAAPPANGPTYPPPGGVTLVESPSTAGAIGKAGGLSRTYTALDNTAYGQIAWGPNSATSFRFSLEGAPVGTGPVLSFSSMAGNVATWSGSSPYSGLFVSGTAQLRLVITARDLSNNPINWTAEGSLPSVNFGAALPVGSAGVGAVLPVTTTGFKTNLLVEANNGSGWMPANDFYDTLNSSLGTTSDVGGGFYTTPAAPPTASLTPATDSFGSTAVGASSVNHTFTVTNTGTSLLTFAGTPFSFSGAGAGDFQQMGTTCVATLVVGASCTVSVAFSPTTTGLRSATLNIADDTADSPQTATLTGTGTSAHMSFAPASPLDVGNVVVGSQTVGTFSFTNDGTAPLSISGPPAESGDLGDFPTLAPQGTCVLPLNPGDTCAVDITFQPTTTGLRTVTLTFSYTGAGSPATYTVTGHGTAPQAALTPPSVAFPSTVTGAVSPAQTLTLSNAGTAALSVTSFAVTGSNPGDFTIVGGSCPSVAFSLPAASSCTVDVTFAPSASGGRTASLNAATQLGSRTSTLTGTGVTPTAVGSLTPPTLSFGSTSLGNSSPGQNTTLSSTGTAPLSVTSLSITGTNPGDFAIGGTCPTAPFSLAPTASCAPVVTFTPTATGARSATLTVVTNAGTFSTTLSGTGTASADLSIAIKSSLATVKVNDNPTYTITVKNNGPNTSSSLTVVDTIPANATYVSIAASGWSCSTPPVGATGTVVCTRASLATGATSTLSLVVKVASGGKTSMTNTASVSSATTDPISVNNNASVTVSVYGKR